MMKIGIALGSGGVKGFANVAYLNAIDEMGVKLNAISGTGLGGLIGAFYAGGMPANEIQDLLKDFERLYVDKVVSLTMLSKTGFVLVNKFEAFLRKKLPVQRFEDLKIPLKISATNYWSKEEFIYDKGDIIPAICSCVSIPGLIKPYYYKCNLFYDGMLVNPVPFDLLFNVDFIIAVDVMGSEFIEGNKFPGTLDALSGSFQIMKKAIMKQKGAEKRVDMYCTPNLRKYRSLWFHKSEAIINAAQRDMISFKKELSRLEQDFNENNGTLVTF